MTENSTYWMIVTEDIDGQWFNDPKVFRTRGLAEKWAAGNPPPDGYSLLLYRCEFRGAIP